MVDRALNDDLERLKSRLVAQGASLDAYLRAMDMTEEAFRQSRREGVALRLRNSLFLQRKIAEKEGIAVDDTDVYAAVERLVASAAEAATPPGKPWPFGAATMCGISWKTRCSSASSGIAWSSWQPKGGES